MGLRILSLEIQCIGMIACILTKILVHEWLNHASQPDFHQNLVHFWAILAPRSDWIKIFWSVMIKTDIGRYDSFVTTQGLGYPLVTTEAAKLCFSQA
jgi:hypothetical protein